MKKSKISKKWQGLLLLFMATLFTTALTPSLAVAVTNAEEKIENLQVAPEATPADDEYLFSQHSDDESDSIDGDEEEDDEPVVENPEHL